MKRTFEVSYTALREIDINWEIVFELDDQQVLPNVKSEIEMLPNWEGQLRQCNGDYIELFLKTTARIVFAGVNALLDNIDDAVGEMSKVIGDIGIKIVHVDKSPISAKLEDFAMKELTQS